MLICLISFFSLIVAALGPSTYSGGGGHYERPASSGGYYERPSSGGSYPRPGNGGHYPRPESGGHYPRPGDGGHYYPERCLGGDNCCAGQCDVGEGDCDRHSDCRHGLLCGKDNCPLGWDTDDDCCYDPKDRHGRTVGGTCSGGDSCCSGGRKCGAGEGDCDHHSDCREGLLCGHNNCPVGPGWEYDDDCCYHPHQGNGGQCLGGDDCCSHGRCDVGEGDCDHDSDCKPGLKCGNDNCPIGWDKDDDCCYDPRHGGGGKCLGGDDCCSHGRCGVGEGDCDRDTDCQPGLRCGQDNCPHGWDKDDDCCYKPWQRCSGADDCCSYSRPCGRGEGDCDRDTDCQSGLTCGNNNCLGKFTGNFDRTDDCCE